MKKETRTGNDHRGSRSFDNRTIPTGRHSIDPGVKPVSLETASAQGPQPVSLETPSAQGLQPVSLETASAQVLQPVSLEATAAQPHHIVVSPSQHSDRRAWTTASERLNVRVITDRLLLLEQEIQHGGDNAVQYFRRALPLAKQALDAAREAIAREEGSPRSPVSEAQVRETIRALGSEETWLELLQAHEMDNSETTREAVRRIAQAIRSIDDDDVSPNFKQLLADIDFLRSEVARALRTVGKGSEFRYFHELLKAAKEVSAEVATAMLIATAQDQARPWAPDVVHAGLGTAVGYSIRTLYATLVSRIRTPTPAAMLRRQHFQLIGSVRNLTFCLPYTILPEPLPKLQDVIDGARLRSILFLTNVDQLAIEIPFAGRDRYRATLDRVRGSLERMREITTLLVAAYDPGLAKDLTDLGDDLLEVVAELDLFSESIKMLLRRT